MPRDRRPQQAPRQSVTSADGPHFLKWPGSFPGHLSIFFEPRLRGFFLREADRPMTSLTQLARARLIKLRWLSVGGMFAAAVLSPHVLGTGEVMHRLLAFTAVVASVSLAQPLLGLLDRGDRLSPFSPLLQLGFDLAAWAVYIYLSGGATNPLISIFLPLVAIGASVLGRVQAWGLGIAAILAYSFLWRFHVPLPVPDAERAAHLHLAGMWLVFAVSALVVVWFIRQMRQAVRERDAALAEAREKAIRNDWLVAMGGLAAGAAHQLSTPLGTLGLLVDEWLDESALPAALHDDLALMQRQVAVCKQALTQLTERAGQPRGGDGMPVGQWLQGCLLAWQALNPAAATDVAISPRLDGVGLPIDVSLERALANLLDNARHAGATRIDIRAERHGGELRVDIDDDGPGIAPAALADLAAGRPAASNGGMGIGLLLTRAALERLGGRLALQRLPGRGTRASLLLPLAPFSGETT